MTSTHIRNFKLYKSTRFLDRVRTRVSERKAHTDLNAAIHNAGTLWGEVEFAG